MKKEFIKSNIYPEAEYEKRVEEQQRLIREMNAKNQLALGAGDRQEKKASGQNIKEYHEIRFLAGHFDPQEFYHMFELNAFINAEEFPAFQTDGKRGTLLISCGILSPVYQTFAL